ncbi:MAG: MATE family efflux transporter [Clostridiales bacterium]|nr:MATE family efflux transporter [Clostridiales bacterium]
MELQKENKMGHMPVNKLLLSMSLPIMVSMLVQASYNVVDSVFVAMIDENALTAVSLAFPIQSLMIAVAVGTGVGINAVLSKSLGEKKYDKVNMTAANGVFLAIISYLVFLVTGLTAVVPFYRSQTADAQILQYGKIYLTIICVSSLGIFVQITFERILQSTGKTIFTMLTQGTGAIINIILDPILIFGLLGMPKLGMAGSAVATVMGQTIAGILAVVINHKANQEVKIHFKGFRPNKDIIKQIYLVGIPSIVMQAMGSLMTYGINLILISFTATATAVFGVYFKLQSFVFMPIFGLNNGMVPIIAYNYGAGKKDRLIKTIKLSIVYAVLLMIVGFIIFQTCPHMLLLLFNASETMLSIGKPALRIISIGFLVAGFSIICSSVFQALGNGIYSMIISLIRQLIVLLPAAYLLSRLGNVNYVWWAFPIAEIVAIALSAFFLIRIYRKVIRHIGEIKEEI